jgi:hypothetical protein
VTADSSRRWRRFRYGWAAPGEAWREPGEQDLSGGLWRHPLPGVAPALPAWPAGERYKALSADGQVLRKFEGIACYGTAAYQRAVLLAEAGWSPPPLGAPSAAGFVRYRFVPGRPLDAAQSTPALCRRLGVYIADRARLLPVADLGRGAEEAFTHFLSTNVSLVLGRRWESDAVPAFVRPTLVDGHLQPHEWIAGANDKRLWKTDAVAHGDDHFFPGPTDIAWDLAGAIVEWALPPSEAAHLIDSYRQASGDNPRPRLNAFILAYAAFRARLTTLYARDAELADAERWRALGRHYAEVVRRTAPR